MSNAIESKNSIGTSTPYDDIFRTLITYGDTLAARLTNEMFSEHIDVNARCEPLQNEVFLADNRKRIMDSHLRFEKIQYIFHMECESIAGDAAILIRLFEYDASVALCHARYDDDKLYVTFPKTGVLYLRDTANTPDVMQMVVESPTERKPLIIDVPVMKVSSYTLDDIIDRELWFLFPFYIFNFEKRLKSSSVDRIREVENEVIEYIQDTEDELKRLIDEQKIDAYTHGLLRRMMIKAILELAGSSEAIRKGAETIMGGRLLDFEENDILNRGREEGLEKGRELGHEERDREKIQDMLLKGRLPQEISDFCDYPIALVKEVQESMTAGV